MKPRLLLAPFFLLMIISIKAQKREAIPGQYIVILKESAATPVIKKQKKNINREQKFNDNNEERQKNLNKVKEVRQRKNIKESDVLEEYADVTVGFSAKLNDKEKKDLESDPDVEAVYQDYAFDIGPLTLLPILATSVQQVGCNVTNAGGFVDGSSKSTCIWILDTGIDTDHPDLNVETKNAKSFVPNQTLEDGHGHGTHCAGIAAAKNNSFGSVGISAGAKVVPVKVLSDFGKGWDSWTLAGLNHVSKYDIPGDVVNMSLGGYDNGVIYSYEKSAVTKAIKALGDAGTWVVMAAGNDGGDAANHFPGCINGNRVITVGSINCNKDCSSFSNFNSFVVDYVATGENVYSTYKSGGYASLSGTSMATPAVAGIIHSKNGFPNSGGTVTCRRIQVYKIAVR